MNKKPVKIIDSPTVDDIKGNDDREYGQCLINLFKYIKEKVGIQEKVDVDPTKIKFNKPELGNLLDDVFDLFQRDQQLKIGLIWMNQGPSNSSDVPEGKIYLYEGYMTKAEVSEEI